MDTGIILDLETTGTDALSDKIIEIGIIQFRVPGGQELPLISNMYGAVEDPGEPLSEEIQKITGLKDDVLRGQSIDWSLVRKMMEDAAIVIAHNADFDRGFLEQRPELKGIEPHWACSMKHIDWQKHGFKTRALNYLAADHGFVNPFAHRALFDCAATFRLIVPYFAELVNRSYMKEFLLLATGAPFASKDLLKARSYRWNSEKRVWHKTVMEDTIAEERAFLAEQVYPGTDLHEEEIIT